MAGEIYTELRSPPPGKSAKQEISMSIRFRPGPLAIFPILFVFDEE